VSPTFFIMKKDRELIEGVVILLFIISTVGWFWVLALMLTGLL
jgi:hypothetical protein